MERTAPLPCRRGVSQPRAVRICFFAGAGLPYSVMEDGTFLYDPAEVSKFIKRHYAPQQIKETLKQ